MKLVLMTSPLQKIQITTFHHPLSVTWTQVILDTWPPSVFVPSEWSFPKASLPTSKAVMLEVQNYISLASLFFSQKK